MSIGTDIIEIERIAKAIEKTAFLNKCFTPAEQALIKKKGPQSAAANFAGKEAVVKALGTGFKGFPPREIEILRDPETGAPYVTLSPTIKEKLGTHQLLITLSHCKAYATATALLIH